MTFTDTQPGATDRLRTPDWYRTATRWTQLTFTDDDPPVLDVDFWIDVMRQSRSNALCLSAGGYMAFYPTTIPFHHRSRHLGGTDPFGALVEGARDLGMHVMARIDPHAVHQDAADAHPEWLARDEDGAAIPHASMPGLWWTDPFSTYHREFITDVALEIVREYDVDAVFANRWEGHGGISYAEGTARQFLADTGHALPRSTDPDGAGWRAYAAWRSRKLSELVVLWDDAVRAVKPHVRFIPNRGANLTRDLVREMVDDRYPMFFIDKQGRSGIEAAWEPGRIAKRARGLYPERPVALITSVGPEDHDRRWKDSVADPEETIGLIVDGFAQGAQPWFTKFKAECYDTRWVSPVVAAFRLHERCEPVLGRLTPTAEVAVLDCRPPAEARRPFHASYVSERTAHENGFYQALLESRVPFEYVAGESLTADRLRGVRTLILPACPDLTAEQVRTIEDYVAGGGSVVAAYDSGLADEGTRLALSEVLGVRLVKGPRGPLKNKYMTIESSHPVTQGFDGARRIVAGTSVLGVETVGDSEAVFRFVPDYPDLPMEEVYPRPGETPPAVVVREHPGGGRTAFLAFDAGQVYWESLQWDHRRLLANAVRWTLGDGDPQVRVLGHGLVDIAVREGAGELAVTVVNLTNPMAMRGQSHELLPLADQEVLVRMPGDVTDVTASLVVGDRAVPVTVAEGVARVRIDRIERLEVVHLVWPLVHGA